MGLRKSLLLMLKNHAFRSSHTRAQAENQYAKDPGVNGDVNQVVGALYDVPANSTPACSAAD
jgi:hypothetical protein